MQTLIGLPWSMPERSAKGDDDALSRRAGEPVHHRRASCTTWKSVKYVDFGRVVPVGIHAQSE